MAAKKKPVHDGHRRRPRPRRRRGGPGQRDQRGRRVHAAAAAAGRPDRQGRGRRRRRSSPSSSPSQKLHLRRSAETWLRSWSSSSTPRASVKKVTLELLTAARALGEPVGGRRRRARQRGAAGRQAGRVRRGEGVRGRVRGRRQIPGDPAGPRCWPSWSRPSSPAAVLSPRRPRARRSPPGWRSGPAAASSPTRSAWTADGTADPEHLRRRRRGQVAGADRHADRHACGPTRCPPSRRRPGADRSRRSRHARRRRPRGDRARARGRGEGQPPGARPTPRSSSPAAAGSAPATTSRSSRRWPTRSGGAVGASRAATDAGWYPHQTRSARPA